MSKEQELLTWFLTADLIKQVAEEENLSLKEAMDKVYTSNFFKKILDPQTKLYRESAAYNFSLWRNDFAMA